VLPFGFEAARYDAKHRSVSEVPMAIPMEVLAAEALALPPVERSQLLDRLLASFDPEPLDPAWERAWTGEVDRREALIVTGQSSWIRGDEVVARLRAELK